jgi:hypothetical protein
MTRVIRLEAPYMKKNMRLNLQQIKYWRIKLENKNQLTKGFVIKKLQLKEWGWK